MVQPRVEVCSSWCTPDMVRAQPAARSLPADADDAFLTTWCSVASWLLFHATGRQWPGNCTDTVRPCRRAGGGRNYSTFSWGTWRWDSSWGDCGCGRNPMRSDCGCGNMSEITLGAAPIVDVTEVIVDGEVLPDDAYRVDDSRWLVRLDDSDWPCCQDLRATLGAPGTFGVTFIYGGMAPLIGQQSSAQLATQLALAAVESESCELPERLSTLSRQGQSFAILDPFDFLEKGRTGIYLVDLFIKQANPQGAQRSAAVFNPDLHRPARRSSTPGGS